MKRLLGLLLGIGMVGCGGKENAGNTVDPSIGADEQLVTDSGGEKSAPSNPKAKVDEPPVQTVDASPAGEAALPSPPEKPQAKVDEPPVQTDDVDPVVSLKELGAQIGQDDQGRVVELYLSSTKITDAGLVNLKGLSNLQYLGLDNTKITDAGLVNLKGLTELRRLNLVDAKVTDAGLVNLKELTNLTSLNLNGTEVTDAGLAHLKGLTNLQGLDLRRTKITDAGVAELKKALPNCKIRK